MTPATVRVWPRTSPVARVRLGRRGMTLIELMIALGILVGALLGMGRFITSFAHTTSDGSLSSTASDLVLDRLELIKATTSYPALSTFGATESAIPGYAGFTRVTRVARTSTPQTDYTTITVSVTSPAMARPVKKSTIISAF